MRLKQRRRSLISKLEKINTQLQEIEEQASQLFLDYHYSDFDGWPMNGDTRLVEYLLDEVQLKLLDVKSELE